MACLLNSAVSCLAAVFNEWRDYLNESTTEHYFQGLGHLKRVVRVNHHPACLTMYVIISSMLSHIPRRGQKLRMRTAQIAFKVRNQKSSPLASTLTSAFNLSLLVSDGDYCCLIMKTCSLMKEPLKSTLGGHKHWNGTYHKRAGPCLTFFWMLKCVATHARFKSKNKSLGEKPQRWLQRCQENLIRTNFDLINIQSNMVGLSNKNSSWEFTGRWASHE